MKYLRLRKMILVMLISLSGSLIIQSCNKSKTIDLPNQPTHLLLGEWQLIEKAGNDYPAPGTSLILTFDVSGSAQSCYEGDDNPLNNGCDSYTWKWKENSEATLIMTYTIDEIQFEITNLTETSLEFNITDEPLVTSYKYIRLQ